MPGAVPDRRVERVRADIFAWRPSEPADLVFSGFWLVERNLAGA